MTPSVRFALRYHRWIYSQIQPFVKGRVLEIGMGHGLYTQFLSQNAREVVATDIDQEVIDSAGQIVSAKNVTFRRLDLTDIQDLKNLEAERFDTVVCLNVLEHIEDDYRSVQGMANSLASGGHLIIDVPCDPRLYNALDSFAGHYRRYTPQTLSKVLEKAGLHVTSLHYVNLLGAVGWWTYGRLFRPKSLADDSVNFAAWFFDRVLVPVSMVVDTLTARSIAGQSLIGVGQKP